MTFKVRGLSKSCSASALLCFLGVHLNPLQAID